MKIQTTQTCNPGLVESPLPLRLRTAGLRLRFILLASLGFVFSTRAFDLTKPEPPPKLRPPRPEIAPTFWEQSPAEIWHQHKFAIIVLALAFLGIVSASLWYFLRAKPSVTVPPGVRARHELERLKSEPENGALLSRVSQVLRRGVAEIFSLPPYEMTTSEFCRAMGQQPKIEMELGSQIGSFLRNCDELKFAAHPVQPPFGAVSQALGIIERADAAARAGQDEQ